MPTTSAFPLSPPARHGRRADTRGWLQIRERPSLSAVLPPQHKALRGQVARVDNSARGTGFAPLLRAPEAANVRDSLNIPRCPRQATHFKANGGTKDVPHGYRKADALKLAAENPDGAVENASNYEYFVVEASGGACPVGWLTEEEEGDSLPAQQAVMSPQAHAGEGAVAV